MNDSLKLKKDKNLFLLLISVLTVIALFVNIEVHNKYFYDKQFTAYENKIRIESIDLNYRVTNPEIIGAINSMSKRSKLLNDVVNGLIPSDYPLLIDKLNQLKMDYSASIIYVMDKEGVVVACTPYNDNKTLTGKNYSFRPYFTNAIDGSPVIYPAVGVTTGQRGLYYAFPIFDIRKDHNGEVPGVLIAKMNFSVIDTLLDGYSDPSALVSSSGIVFSSNVKEWMFEEMFSDEPVEISAVSLNPEKIVYNNRSYSVFSSSVSLEDESGSWRLVSLHKFNKWYDFTQPWLISFLLIVLYVFLGGFVIQYTGKLLLEMEQKKSKEELKAIIASMDDLLFVLDSKNIFISYYHPSSDSRLFAPADFFIGKTLKETMPANVALLAEETIESVKNTGVPRQFDYPLEMEGQIKWYSAKVSKRKNLSGSYAGVTVVVRDISNLKVIENDLKKSKIIAEEANKAKSDFLANMSHEIRTPMNAIIGFTELLYDKEDNFEKKSKLGMIKTSGQNLLALINDILDFSKIEAGKIDIENKNFSLRSSMDNLYSMCKRKADEKSLDYNINIDKSVPEYVFGDEHRIIQILTNIIGNALKFTKDGSITIDLSYENGIAVIKIADTGIGIPEDKQEHIFSAFIQADSSTERNFGGTGLGLAISRQLVELLGGTLAVSSTVGVGSVFILKFPLPEMDKKDKNLHSSGVSYKNPKVVENPEEYDIKSISEHKILVAEDNKINQALIKAMMKDLGYECEIAENGRVAIDKLKSQQYDLLFLDIQMPVMDGLETIKYIRENKDLKELYVIALTANALAGDADKYIKAGCNDYVSKPVDREVLKNKVTKIFGASL